MDLETKIRLLREATRGPDDVFALRSDADGRGPPWKPLYASLTDENILMHLAGLIEVGSYALVPWGNDFPRVWWIAADFDGKKCKVCQRDNPRGARVCLGCSAPLPDWQLDVQRTVDFLLAIDANLLVNLSRSAQGAHVRVLFREPVPAWMARRWMQAWLEEADVVDDFLDDGRRTSFDRIVPPQDTLLDGLTRFGTRRPGNLIGSPHNKRLAERDGASLALDPQRVARGVFEPDGRHWEHLARAVENRAWDETSVLGQLEEAPGTPSVTPPAVSPAELISGRELRVIQAQGALDFTLNFCAFMRHMRQSGEQPYSLWVALAAQLHRFGEDGKEAFHQISAIDPRYKATDVERKWEQTADMHPIKCSTLVSMGYRCPNLDTPHCNGARAPAYLFEHARYEPL